MGETGDVMMGSQQNGDGGLPLSLRSVGDGLGDSEDQSISSLLFRIGRQRGSFRDFTETSLLEELADPARIVTDDIEEEKKDDTIEEVVENAVEKDKPTDTEVRDNLLLLISSALNESALALDFTSLLLSSNRATAAQSMSPALKEAIPAASLSHTRVRRTLASRDTASNETLLGFKAQGLSEASAALSKASAATTDSQTTDEVFWQEVQQLIDNGWKLFRPRGDTVGLAVRFGSGYRHYVQLEKDEEGHIDASRFESKQAILRFTLLRAGKIIATQATDDSENAQDSDNSLPPIVKHLKRARKSLITTEIFEDLIKEARDCANQGTTIIDRMITIPLGNDYEAGIELVETEDDPISVTVDEDQDVEMTDELKLSENTHAELLLCTLATIVYSQSSSRPKIHSLKRFLSTYRHGQNSVALTNHMQRLIQGLQVLSWQQVPTIACTTSPGEIWDKAPSTTIDCTFLGTDIRITIVTTLRSITTYTITCSSPSSSSTEFSAGTQRQLKTHDPEKVLDMVMFELNEVVMNYLTSANLSCMRCSEDQIRYNHGVVTVVIKSDGKIQLFNGSGGKKVVETDLATEIIDSSKYT